MQNSPTDENPRLSVWVQILTGVVMLVLMVGITLFYAPSLVAHRWPWKIPPFNARFLGAVYLAEAASIIPFILINRWSPGRVGLVAAFIFTTVATIGTVIHVDGFLGGRKMVAWFFIYGIYAILSGFALWLYKDLPSVRPMAKSEEWTRLLKGAGIAVGLYGVAMFVAPSIATAFWPWTVDGLHARIYCAAFMASGAGLWMVGRDGARDEAFIVALFLGVFGIGAILGLWLAHLDTGRAAYGALSTWVWIAMFAGLGTLGLALGRLSRSAPS